MNIADHIDNWCCSEFRALTGPPWAITQSLATIILGRLEDLSSEYELIAPSIAVHPSAEVDSGALVKPPAVIGPDCFIGSGSLVRGGVWLMKEVIIGPGVELKTSIVFGGSKLAHFNFVGDSILGGRVNLEAGSIIANARNELDDPEIVVRGERTGMTKFGALVGDDVRIGANAVIAPGALISRRTVIGRLELIDQRSASG